MSRKKSSKNELVMPDVIYANVSPKSIGGRSLFDAGQVTQETVADYHSEGAVIASAEEQLKNAGFTILHKTETTINIAGSAETYNNAFNTNLYTEEREVVKPQVGETTATFIEAGGTDRQGFIDMSGTAFENMCEGLAIEEPRYFMASAYPPSVQYWHLDVPGDVSLGCNADRAHRGNITGRGVKIAMVDSGHYAHPFFTQRGYRVKPVTLGPATQFPDRDESGHGTGESANIFAVAPDAELWPVKINFVNSTGAFNTAVGLNPDIITCSWGSDKPKPENLSAADIVLGAAVAQAVKNGTIVVFAAGNGHWGFPGQHTDVISAGGVFMSEDGALRASNYASGFMSNIYPNRRVPDLSGLVGMSPGAMYIMLPVEPGDNIDSRNQGGSHPRSQGATSPFGDETAGNDGWAAFSGTSAAAPQLAGAAALVKQVYPSLKPSLVRSILMRSARDVTQGTCHPNTGGNAAIVGPDTATGNGLVDARKAVILAKIARWRSIWPVVTIPQPIRPIAPAMTIVDTNGDTDADAQSVEQPAITNEDFDFMEELVLAGDVNL